MPDKPIPKLYTTEEFKKKADTLLQGIYGTTSKDYFIDLIQKEVDKGIKEEAITMEDAVKFLKTRKKYYDTELGKQNQDIKKMPPSYQTEVEGRTNFLDGGDTKYNALVTKKYIELGGEEGTGMDIDKFAEEYFPKMAEGGRIGYKDGPKIKIQASGSKTGKNQIEGAPKGITYDSESIDAIIKADIPISQKIDLLADYQYGKGRTRIDNKDQEIFLDEGGFKNRNVGLGFNQDGEGISGSIMRNLETGDDDFKIRFLKRFANGGRIGFDKGTMPKSERWMRDYFFSGKGGYDDRMSYQEFALGPGQELFKRFNKKNGGVMYGKYAKQILSS